MVEMERIIEPMGKVPLKRGRSVTCGHDEPKGNLLALAHLSEAFWMRSLPTFANPPGLIAHEEWLVMGSKPWFLVGTAFPARRIPVMVEVFGNVQPLPAQRKFIRAWSRNSQSFVAWHGGEFLQLSRVQGSPDLVDRG